MDNNCQIVVFSDKAYNAIIRETFEWEPVETGGILLGHILDNGCWIVMEVLPPGYGEGREGDNVYHEYGYFEYNRKFVNYLAKSVAEQYKIPLELLGLWHRHPGNMDHFSGTDDITNITFAQQNPQGTISGLVNVDPQLRMTMYYLSHGDSNNGDRSSLNYQEVQVEVGSDLIPEEYFKLRYYHGEEKDIHPYPPQRSKNARLSRYNNNENGEFHDDNQFGVYIVPPENSEPLSDISYLTGALKKNKNPLILIIAIVAFLISLLSIKNDCIKLFGIFTKERPSIENTTNKYKYDKKQKKTSKEDTATETADKAKGDTIDKKVENSTKSVKESSKTGKENDHTKHK